LLAAEFPDKYACWTYAPSRDEFFVWLVGFKETLPSDSPFMRHKTSPICWFEKDDGTVEVLGGRDRLVEWTARNHAGSRADKKGDAVLNPFESTKQLVSPRGPVPAGTLRICVAGYSASPNYTRARNCGILLCEEFPDKYVFWTFAPSRDEFFEYLNLTWKATVDSDGSWAKHKTAPICWFESDDGSVKIIGGRDRLVEWITTVHSGSRADKKGKKSLNPFEKNRDYEK